MRAVMKELEAITDRPMLTMADFHDFSVDSPATSGIWSGGVRNRRGPRRRIRGLAAGIRTGPAGTRFFPSSTLNYAENLLAGGDLPGAQDTALVFRREDGVRRVWSWAELRAATSAIAHALRSAGVVPAMWWPHGCPTRRRR